MIIDITQTTKIGRVYRAGSEPLKVEKVTLKLFARVPIVLPFQCAFFFFFIFKVLLKYG